MPHQLLATTGGVAGGGVLAKYTCPEEFSWEKLRSPATSISFERFFAGHTVNPELEKLPLYVVSLLISSDATTGFNSGLVERARMPGVPL